MGKSKEIVRHFNPAWYASVMGTGGLANALYMFLGKIPFFETIAQVLMWFNLVLFVVLLFPWLARWIWHFDRLAADLKNPMLGNFFVTMPVGALLLGANFYMIGQNVFPAVFIHTSGLVLYVFASVLILLFTFVVMSLAYIREDLSPDHLNFSWFITPVANIVVPVLGGPLAAFYLHTNPALAATINMVDIMFYGIGFLLFIYIGAVVFNRLIQHRMPHAQVSPTFWIILGPIGIGVVSLYIIAGTSQSLGIINDVTHIKLLGTMLWGFGFWAFIQTLILTAIYWKEGVPFSMTWWAYIFPLAAYTLSTFLVSSFLKSRIIYWYGVALLVLLSLMWLVVLIKSLISLEHLLFPKNGGKAE